MPRVNKENPSARNWCFTLNNYTDDDKARIAKPYEWVKYVAYAHEVAPSTGTPHLQGFLCCWEPQSMANVKLYLPRAHLEVMHGRLVDNDTYCTKRGTQELIELGERPMQGMRSDLIGFKRKLDEGAQPVDVAEEEAHFSNFVRYHGGLQIYANNRRWKKRCEEGFNPPKTYLRIGAPDIGKSKYVHELHGYIDVWKWNSTLGKFFDGYSGQSVVVFEDVQKDHIPPIDFFKQLLDGYPIRVPIKCDPTGATWLAKTIYITSNEEPQYWYDYDNSTHYNAILSRIFQGVRVYKDRPEEVFHTSTRFHNGLQENEEDHP